MKITVKCTASKGDHWAAVNINIEGSCNAFSLDSELKSAPLEIASSLESKGWLGNFRRYGLNRAKLTSTQSLHDQIVALVQYLMERNTVLEELYPEEKITVVSAN